MGELVVDLLETAGLIPEAKLATVREKAKHLPVVQVLIEEELASSEAIARLVAAQHGLPVVELSKSGIDLMAAESVPLRVLQQVTRNPVCVRRRDALRRDRRPAECPRHRLAPTRQPPTDRVESGDKRGDRERARPARPDCGVRRPRDLRPTRPGSTRRTKRPTTSRPTTASPTPRSYASSTPFSSRQPRTERATSTSIRRPTRSLSASASTACSTRPNGSRSAARSA